MHPHILKRQCPTQSCRTNRKVAHWDLHNRPTIYLRVIRVFVMIIFFYVIKLPKLSTCWFQGPLCTERLWFLHMPGWLHGGSCGQHLPPWAGAAAELKPTQKNRQTITIAPFLKVFSGKKFIFPSAQETGKVTLFTCFRHIIRCLRCQVVKRSTGKLTDHTKNQCEKYSIVLTSWILTVPLIIDDTKQYKNIPIPVVDLHGY